MYILPILTHLEVVALGGRSDISPDQHLNYASIGSWGALEVLIRERDYRDGVLAVGMDATAPLKYARVMGGRCYLHAAAGIGLAPPTG